MIGDDPLNRGQQFAPLIGGRTQRGDGIIACKGAPDGVGSKRCIVFGHVQPDPFFFRRDPQGHEMPNQLDRKKARPHGPGNTGQCANKLDAELAECTTRRKA